MVRARGTNPALAQTQGLGDPVSVGRRHTPVPVLHPKARRQGARGDTNIPAVLIAACNPRITFYCLLCPSYSSQLRSLPQAKPEHSRPWDPPN